MGHELVGWLSDGKRVVANPLNQLRALRGLCWRCAEPVWYVAVVGAGQTPGSFAEFVALPSGQLYEIPSRCLPHERF